ncbi:MAG: hypothetical protein PHS41_05590 [Victivallaceae bacterium]|nr:hypothetical protein [Victivallaceae bacterium]
MAIERVGAPCHLTIARNDRVWEQPRLTALPLRDYNATWSVFQSNLFAFKSTIFGVPRREFCYAGDWFFYLDLGTGIASQCYNGGYIGHLFDDVDRPIAFRPIGYQCPLAHCYNGHAFLSLGVIPELQTPTYASLRNRECPDGREWLTEPMKRFLSGKLAETNSQLSAEEQAKACYQNPKPSRFKLCKYALLSRILWKSKREHYREKLEKLRNPSKH